ncbi:MAG: glycosyltransferase family 2 protein [Weeksellaceae bacterium]|nr:glycosyltransferase family 2 protein [Weeksellaceae bacterium]
MDKRISGSIVLYKNDKDNLNAAISSFLNAENTAESKLYLVDNSPTDVLREMVDIDDRIVYTPNPLNPGFGAAHNIAIKNALKDGYCYHLVINPDVWFEKHVINEMVTFMEQYPGVGMMMPQILNEDHTIQNLPKLLPSPMDVVMRKLKKPKSYYESFINKYELRFVEESQIYNTPILSGCFTLLRLDAIKEVGVYDDQYFMYFEDWDLSRRMHRTYKTIYFPKVSVIHGYESGANKNRKLFMVFIKSAIAYFNKWGWFFDSERNKFNKQALSQLK